MASMPPDVQQPDDAQGADDQEGDEVCVRIELNTKTGALSVGMEQPDNPDGSEESEASEDDGMKPAKDINDAMRMAKMLIESGGQASQPNPQADDQAFSDGYNGAASPLVMNSRGMK